MLPLHGVGIRTDLPISTTLAASASVGVVLASLVAVGFLWRKPRLRGAEAGRPLPLGVQRVADSTAVRTTLQAITLLLVLGVLYVAAVGPAQTPLNVAPYTLYVTFWVGLVPLSLLFGPVWKVVNPLRLLHRLIEWASGTSDGRGTRAVPPRLGWWPAAATLAVFTWLELVYPQRADPRVVAVVLVVYAVANLLAAQTFGAAWFDRGDGFEAWSTLLGRLSVLGRRADGRLVVRSPLQGLTALRDEPGLIALVCVLIGSTAFDGMTRSRFWVENVLPDDTPLGTLGLAGAVAAVALLYVLGTTLAARIGGERRLPGLFAASMVPIAGGYAIAHYFSLFMLEGQTTLVLASDPLRTGADYLGTSSYRINLALVSTTVIAAVQIGAIVVGHVLGVLLSHERAVSVLPERAARRAQVPLGAVMLTFTGTAVALLLST